MNINQLLDQIAEPGAARPAMRHPGGEVTYGSLLEAIRRLARAFGAMGIGVGDRVAIMLPNVPHFPVVYYAALRVGAAAVPVNILYRGPEVAALLEDSEARALVVWSGLWPELARYTPALPSLKSILVLGESPAESIPSLTRLIAAHKPTVEITDVDDHDPAVIEYTSGATGSPKGAELTHGNLISNVAACREVMRTTDRDVFIAAMPFFHLLGQTVVMNQALLTGATLELHPRVDPPEIVRSLQSGSATLFVGVPSLFRMILDASPEGAAPEKPVRLCICGGGSIPEDLLKAFEKRFGTYILEAYTLSETSPVTSFNQWRTGRRVGSLGHPIPGVEMKVVDERGREASIGQEGEIIVKGANVMKRYLNRPRLTAEVLRDGWFYTGDIGKMDINGFFYLVGRKNDRILKAGFSLYPTEIERVLANHPDVADVAVVGVPDPVMGEEIKACVVLKNGAAVTTEQLAAYCRERMAAYKVPKIIRFYKDLPRTSTGRIDRADLKA